MLSLPGSRTDSVLVLCFRAAPAAYRGSQARGQIGASAAGPTPQPQPRGIRAVIDLHHGSRQRQILNPLSEAGDQTRVLMETSWVCNPLSHGRTSGSLLKPCDNFAPGQAWGHSGGTANCALTTAELCQRCPRRVCSEKRRESPFSGKGPAGCGWSKSPHTEKQAAGVLR